MQQEDDLRALAKIMDFLRAVSIILVVMNVYWYCYATVGINIGVVDRILLNFNREVGLFHSILYTKLFAMLLLVLSCLGTKGVFNEKTTIYFKGLDNLIATARSNKVAVCLGFQDFSQLVRDYGDKEAKVVMNTVGNIFSGQVVGETAKQLSERFGKVLQERQSISINRQDVSTSINTQMDSLIPPSKISGLTQEIDVGITQQFQKVKAAHTAEFNVSDNQVIVALAHPIKQIIHRRTADCLHILFGKHLNGHSQNSHVIIDNGYAQALREYCCAFVCQLQNLFITLHNNSVRDQSLPGILLIPLCKLP